MATVKISMALSEKTHELLKKMADEQGLKKSAVVTLALTEYAKKKEGVSNSIDEHK